MQLIYRGVRYEADALKLERATWELTGQDQGQIWRSQVSQVTSAPQQVLKGLKYRGLSYQPKEARLLPMDSKHPTLRLV